MRAIRELPLAASLLLVGLALFFGGGPGSGSLPWLGGAALLVIVVLVATRGVPAGWQRLVPLAALTAWLALSISWSALPDRSWDYANRTLVYLLLAVLGLWLAARTRALALGLMALFGAGARLVAAREGAAGRLRLRPARGGAAARAGRPLEPARARRRLRAAARALAPPARGRAARVRGDRRAALTYSRGGVITAVLVVAAWFVLDDERLESARTLLAAAVPAAVVVGIAFALPGVTGDGQSSHARWRDGLIFGALLIARSARRGAAPARAAAARAAASPDRRRRGGARRARRGGRREGRRLRRRRERRRPPDEHELELQVHVVEAGRARLGAREAPRHGGGDVPRHEPPLPRLVPRLHDRAAQPAVAVLDGGGDRRARAVPARRRRAPARCARAAEARARARAAAPRLLRALARRHRLGLRRGLRARVPGGGSARRPHGAAPRVRVRFSARSRCGPALLRRAAHAMAR